jgi:hypothetical protein
MHRDKKVGLALGVLLLGIVAAFFFRNEIDPLARIPRLKNPRELNNRIAENPAYPYLTGIETDEGRAPRRRTKRPGPSNRSPLWDMPDFLRDARSNTVDPLSQSPIAPDPIPFGNGIPVPRHNRAWKVSTFEGHDLAPNVPSDRLDTLRVHYVEQGDTLSELASRYLGSSARYREIFEINRQVLRNPNDLRVGMRLRIPEPGGPELRSRSAARTNRYPTESVWTHAQPLPAKATSSHRSRTAAPSNRPVPPDRRFIPARRSQPHATSRRTLSQLPPN